MTKIATFAGALAAGICLGSMAIAQEFTARLSLDVQEGNPKYVAAENFAKAVLEATDGAVEFKLFANGLLGGEVESAEGMRLGSIQGGIITSSVYATWVPGIQVLDLPFLFRDDAHATAANAVLTDRLADKFDAQGFHLLGFSINGARQPMSTFPIETPEDVAVRKMRVIQSPIHIALWEAVGANPVPIPATEVYNAMQTGVVDYFDNTATNYLTFKFFEVAPHFTNLRHVYAMGTWVVAKSWWDTLPSEYQEAITTAAKAAEADVAPMLAEVDAASLAETVKLGATLHEVEDKQAWIDRMEPVWAQFAPSIPDAEGTIAALRAIQ
ncbi:TRAP transporter substrate-binding protein [Puniceibacterium confluentis]|uniref:TRAP transporter substrate-binding protein n=1 Tax=Puniceibacterium confluentis TaxID=1958944 RepID=UPI0011B7458F|nr:TRAP transporter substrate-binding protein [Puniceibacterium confluentis]